MMKIAALAVSTAPGGNMSFAFSKSVPIAPAKGRGKRTPAWTNRRAKALVPCGFADAKTAKGILQYQNSRKRLSNCPRIPREEVRKYGSFQSGAKYGIYRYEQPPLAKQGIVLKGKGLVVANAFAARRLGLYPCGLIPYQPGEDRRNPRSGKGTRKSRIYRAQPGARRKGTLGQTNNGLSAFIDASSFKKHAFICGVPGSGKTNTMLHLANSLWHHKKLIKDDTDNLSVTFKEESDPIPFLVLEPAKREYRELSRYDIPELIILSPSASTKFPMRLNPFEFPKGLTLSEHISKLCQVFEGAFPIAPPAPFILDKAIEGIYRAHGWNTNDINTGEKEYPTMSELYDRFQKELSQSINDSLRDVENKAYDVSKDANQNLQSLEQIRQNVDDEITDSQKAKKKLDQTKKLFLGQFRK